MSENQTNNDLTNAADDAAPDEFAPRPISSAELLKPAEGTLEIHAPQYLIEEEPIALDEAEKEQEETDPIFAALAAPQLPALARENRARLQMQSPNRLYFYWSIKNNPFQTLRKVFAGNTGSYQLVARFVNLKTGREDVRPVDAEGNYWLNVESDAAYRAEIGFYAPNRPFVRVIFSNTIETPRKSPSPRAASDADWAISAHRFAALLDDSGFRQDAYEVALAGDDARAAERATRAAFEQFVGAPRLALGDVNADEVRFALLALAGGAPLASLRGQISEALYLLLEEHAARLSAENARTALKEHFEVFDDEIFEEEEIGAAVYGASLVNFPRTLRKRSVPRAGAPKNAAPGEAPRYRAKLAPLSSHSF